MPILEQNILIQHKNKDGNIAIQYPITKSDNVIDLDEHLNSYNYVTKEDLPKIIPSRNFTENPIDLETEVIGNLSSELVTFSDGDTFQDKFNRGELKGENGKSGFFNFSIEDGVLYYLADEGVKNSFEFNEDTGILYYIMEV